MIIRGIKKLIKSDLPDSPDWFDGVISLLNIFMDSVLTALRGKLTFGENILAEIKSSSFVHGIEQEIKYSMPGYGGFLIIKTPNEDDQTKAIDKYMVRQTKSGYLGVTIYFSGAGSTEGSVTFIILG